MIEPWHLLPIRRVAHTVISAGAFAAGVYPDLPIATTWGGLWRALTGGSIHHVPSGPSAPATSAAAGKDGNPALSPAASPTGPSGSAGASKSTAATGCGGKGAAAAAGSCSGSDDASSTATASGSGSSSGGRGGSSASGLAPPAPGTLPPRGWRVQTVGAQLKSRAQLESQILGAFAPAGARARSDGAPAESAAGASAAGLPPQALLMVSGSHPARTLPFVARRVPWNLYNKCLCLCFHNHLCFLAAAASGLPAAAACCLPDTCSAPPLPAGKPKKSRSMKSW